jgi:hypothetical protein
MAANEFQIVYLAQTVCVGFCFDIYNQKQLLKV